MLSLKHVHKSFEHELVLKGVSLDVLSGEIIGLAGPSGSGKSTLLRCIQKLEAIDSGTINCEHPTGFMFQDFHLFPHMTVLENLCYAPRLRKQKDFHARATGLLTQLGLSDKANTYPRFLSGGQKQRVALARSLMMSPKLLLCDEPTSGLDVATTGGIVQLLHQVKAMGVTMIIASHDLEFLSQVADTIIMLNKGEIQTTVNPKTMEEPVKYLQGFYPS